MAKADKCLVNRSRPRNDTAVRRLLLLLTCVLCCAARAERADELAAIHVEAIGGRERIKALGAFRATGSVTAGGKTVGFTLTAARPDRLRLETSSGGRTLVQASDGREPPWEFDTGTWPPVYHEMPPAVAQTFLADAEFDDPLVAGKERGFTFNFTGEVEVRGKKMLRVIVTRHEKETFALLVDPETYFVAFRVDQRRAANGAAAQIITRYDDFRPVNGVLVAHDIVVMVDGHVTQHAKIEQITANPKLSPDTFTRPKSAAAKEKKER